MADTTKKTKTTAAKTATAKTTTAKPRKPAAKKVQAAPAARKAMPSREEIERLAQTYWAQRGYQDGYAEQDWLRAEQELLKMAS